MDNFFTKIYYDPSHPAGFGTVEKLYRASRKAGKSYSRKDVKSFLLKQDTYTLFKPRRKNFSTRKVVTYGLDDVHMSDLADMSNYSGENDGVKYLLVTIDVLSKYAWVIPLKDKKSLTIAQAFEGLYAGENGAVVSTNDRYMPPVRIPYKLGTDQGKEYIAKETQNVFSRYKIRHYVLYNRQKASVAERFIRTLKSKIHKYMDSQGSQRYIHKLSDIIKAYNKTVHSSTGVAPESVSIANAEEVRSRLYQRNRHNKKQRAVYKPGDKVRLSRHSDTFEKSYFQTYTDEIFEVVRVLPTTPPTYKLKDVYNTVIRGSFYQEELTRVIVTGRTKYRIDYVIDEKGRGKTKKYLVKFRGYKEPEWVTSIGNIKPSVSLSKKKKTKRRK